MHNSPERKVITEKKGNDRARSKADLARQLPCTSVHASHTHMLNGLSIPNPCDPSIPKIHSAAMDPSYRRAWRLMVEDEAQTSMENTGKSPAPARGISRVAACRGAANTRRMMPRVARVRCTTSRFAQPMPGNELDALALGSGGGSEVQCT
jgi:hypothetical protein